MELKMCSEARTLAFGEAKADPYTYLYKHFSITPKSDRSAVMELFMKFAAETGVVERTTSEAVTKFLANDDLPDFVLQAASGIACAATS